MTKKYDVECTKAFLYLMAKSMKDKYTQKIIMHIGKTLIPGDWKKDFDFDQAVRMAEDAGSEYKELEDTMQEESDKQKTKTPESPVCCCTTATPTPDDDQVNHPAHYQSYNTAFNIECIDAMRAAFGDEAAEGFCICNAFKYVWRHQFKNGKQDIGKAIWYLNKYLELNKQETPNV